LTGASSAKKRLYLFGYMRGGFKRQRIPVYDGEALAKKELFLFLSIIVLVFLDLCSPELSSESEHHASAIMVCRPVGRFAMDTKTLQLLVATRKCYHRWSVGRLYQRELPYGIAIGERSFS
jgi:hypothetical protein